MWKPEYDIAHRGTTCYGKSVKDGLVFRDFLKGPVAARFGDAETSGQFDKLLSVLSLTGMGAENLDKFLAAEIPEEREWIAALGEAGRTHRRVRRILEGGGE